MEAKKTQVEKTVALTEVNGALLEFARLVARMATEEEAGGFTAEDAIATVNDLIETARPLVAKVDALGEVL